MTTPEPCRVHRCHRFIYFTTASRIRTRRRGVRGFTGNPGENPPKHADDALGNKFPAAPTTEFRFSFFFFLKKKKDEKQKTEKAGVCVYIYETGE